MPLFDRITATRCVLEWRSGPTLKFHAPAVVALAGAEFAAQLDGQGVPCWTSVAVPAGGVLTIGSVRSVAGPACMHTATTLRLCCRTLTLNPAAVQLCLAAEHFLMTLRKDFTRVTRMTLKRKRLDRCKVSLESNDFDDSSEHAQNPKITHLHAARKAVNCE